MSFSTSNISTVILDRDGVINVETGNYVKSVDEWQILKGSVEAIARLTKAGYRIFVATNQAGITKGLYTKQILDDIHALMLKEVEEAGGHIEAVHYCPHTDENACDCRKPKPGLLNQISNQHNVDLAKAVMVGDSIRDLQAGLGAGTLAVMVTDDNATKVSLVRRMGDAAKQIMIYSTLADFADDLLS